MKIQIMQITTITKKSIKMRMLIASGSSFIQEKILHTIQANMHLLVKLHKHSSNMMIFMMQISKFDYF